MSQLVQVCVWLVLHAVAYFAFLKIIFSVVVSGCKYRATDCMENCLQTGFIITSEVAHS